MTKETNVLLAVTTHGREDREIKPYCRIKLDSKGFPYIAIHNQKYIISQTTFPQEIHAYGYHDATITGCIEGLDELEQILANPELTVDRLSPQELMRVSSG